MPSRNAVRSLIERRCVDKGLKMTGQRRVIARILSEATDHPDVEQVFRRASNIDKRISLATVYRTVRLFDDANILDRHEFGKGRARYEIVSETHHDHLIDIETGTVHEFVSEEIERLQRHVAEKLGYRLVDHRLALFGVPLKPAAAAKRRRTPGGRRR